MAQEQRINDLSNQSDQLGNPFFLNEPFVDNEIRLPPRDDPAFLRQRASGLVNDAGDPSYIDPYTPLPQQQPPPILSYDQGVDIPIEIQTPLQKGLLENSLSEQQAQQQISRQPISQLPTQAPAPAPAQAPAQTQPQNQLPSRDGLQGFQTTEKETDALLERIARALETPRQLSEPVVVREPQNRVVQDQIPLPPLSSEQATNDEGFPFDLDQPYYYPKSDDEDMHTFDAEEMFDTEGIYDSLIQGEELLDIADTYNIPEDAPRNVSENAPRSDLLLSRSEGKAGEGQRYLAHLASYFDASDARRGWRILTDVVDNLLIGLKMTVRPVTIRGRQYYRLLAGPFEAYKIANLICKRFKEKGIYCVVMPF